MLPAQLSRVDLENYKVIRIMTRIGNLDQNQHRLYTKERSKETVGKLEMKGKMVREVNKTFKNEKANIHINMLYLNGYKHM